jgi:hypothetical protein
MNSKRYYLILSTELLILTAEIITTLGEAKKFSGLPMRVFHFVIRKEKKKKDIGFIGNQCSCLE